MKSNLDQWKKLQEDNYFENHPCYQYDDGTLKAEADDDKRIARFLNLEEKKRVAVIGCGFGRDVSVIAPKVGHVWGIDVNQKILEKAKAFLTEKGITNFTPVLAQRWKAQLPCDLDFVYSVIVFQHLTRDLVKDYILGMSEKLSDKGEMLCQFADLVYGTNDVEKNEPHEPSVRWNESEIKSLVEDAGMSLYQIQHQHIPDHGDWLWAHFGIAQR